MDEWRELYKKHGRIFFSDPDYILLWWRTLGTSSGWKWHLVTLRDNGKLVAAAPLAVRAKRGLRLAQWAGVDVFDYCDVLLASDTYLEALWEAVEKSPHYSIALLTDIHPESKCRPLLERVAHCYGKAEASCLNLVWKDGEEWLKSLTSAYRKNYNRQSRRLEEAGALKYEVVRSAPVPANIIDFIVEQKIAWCQQLGISSIFTQPRVKEYFLQLAERAAEKGTLALSSLYCGDVLVAAQMDFVENRVFYTYMPSYHQEWAAYSPGRIIEYRSIMWAIENGCTRFDLMRGSEEYKKRLTEDYQTLHHYMLASGILSKACGTMYLTLRWLKSKISKDEGH